MTFPRVLVIAGIDPTGRAGIARDLAALGQERAEGAVVVSALTVQDSRGVRRIQPVDPSLVAESISTALGGRDIDAVKVGLVADNATCRAIASSLKGLEVPVVLDPVMRASSGDLLTCEDTVAGLRDLMLQATVLTPNIPEAEALTGQNGTSVEDRFRMASSLIWAGARAVMIKGGHAEEGRGVDILLEGDGRRTTYPFERLEFRTRDLGRGKGCELSTRIAALMAKGLDLPEAVRVARLRLGERLSSEVMIDRFPQKDAMRDYVTALDRLLSEVTRDCIPEVGTNLAYAMQEATSLKDVLGLAGRVTPAGESIAVAGSPRPGGPHHTAKIAFTASRLLSHPVWVMNHRHAPGFLKNLGSEHVVVSRNDEPPNAASTMEWMTERAVKEKGVLPSYISDDGSKGKEPMIRILAKSPEELLRLHRHLHGETI